MQRPERTQKGLSKKLTLKLKSNGKESQPYLKKWRDNCIKKKTWQREQPPFGGGSEMGTMLRDRQEACLAGAE